MSYIGNQPYQSAFVTDTFSGNGSTTAFTMSVAPAGTTSVLVAVTGVLQDPSTYSVTGTTLTFSAAPPSGTGNISVRYLGIPASGVTTTAYRTVTEFTATAGQTTFTPPSYTVGYINVYRNGVLLGSADYTATNGTTVVLAKAATAGDLVVVESFYVSSVLNAISTSGGTIAGNLTINSASGQAPLVVQANGSYGLVTDSSGNVGIGTSSPAQKLNVSSASNTYIQTNGATSTGAGLLNYVGTTLVSSITDAATTISGGTTTDGAVNAKNNLIFGTNAIERARIDSSGNFLVGGTSADGKLVVTTGASTPVGRFYATLTSSYTSDALQVIVGQASGTGYYLQRMYVSNGSTVQFAVRGDGTVYAQNTTIQSLSDVRTKENVRDADDGLQKVLGLRPVRFDFKEGFGNNRKNQLGFIAQEMEQVFPDAVDTTGEKDENGDPYKSVGPSALIPVLVKAIQELNAKVEAQAAEIAQLKGQA